MAVVSPAQHDVYASLPKSHAHDKRGHGPLPRLIGDNISEPHAANPEDVEAVLRTLTYREREIFKLRTGFRDGYRYTLEEVGHIFKVSAARISQIHKRGRQKFLDRIARFRPETEVDPLVVTSVLEQAKELTPFLIAHLKHCPNDLRLLPWQVFEQLIAEFFASWGYNDVQLVGRNGRTAADIFAMKIELDGTEVRVFVETKRWKKRVGVEVIDRVYGAFLAEKTTFGWHMAMVVTSAKFTNMQKYTPGTLRMMNISLKDGDDVTKWLTDYRFSEKGLWLPDVKLQMPSAIPTLAVGMPRAEG